MNMTMISNDIQHKAKKSQKHIQQPEDMTWNMDHLLKYRNVVYAVKELPMISIKIDQKMFGILVDHHPHLHGLWKLGTPKSSESSKSKGFSWFLLVSHHFSLLKLTFNEVFPHVQTDSDRSFCFSGGLQSANATVLPKAGNTAPKTAHVDTETKGWSQAKFFGKCQAMEPWQRRKTRFSARVELSLLTLRVFSTLKNGKIQWEIHHKNIHPN